MTLFRPLSPRRLLPALFAAGMLAAAAIPSGAETAAPCQNTGNFPRWLDGFRKEALAQGLKRETIEAALGGMTLDQQIIYIDRGQKFFYQSFLDFQAKLATGNRVSEGRAHIAKHRAIFDREEKEYGVPAAVIAALWALESDFGSGMGNRPVLRSLAALAYDCRRGEMFRKELMDALRIIERGDLRPSEMIGSWAGELGQTQFLPSHYYKYAVDYEGSGRRDLLRSPANVIGSTGNFIASLGWTRGEPWLEEVKVPAELPWQEADPAVKHPRSYWAKLGVTYPDGRALAGDETPVSLLLLMGRNGPAFITYRNFDVLTTWNQSLNYATTAAYLANRIAGAPPMSKGRAPVPAASSELIRDLQLALARQGFDVGDADGRLGLATRAAIRKAQVKVGLPADAYPSLDLLQRLRR